jgi:hypothetical protein
MVVKTHSQNGKVIIEFPVRFKCVKALTFMIYLMSYAITLLFMNDIPGNQLNALIRCLH